MQITIHRGTREIGGTCIEVREGGRSILLDLGLPLDPDAAPTDVSGLTPDALLISHPHMDHFGSMDSLPETVPVYMGRLAKDLIDATRVFLKKPLINREIHYIKARKPFEVAGFRITPYLVDHSSPEAFAFLIESGGQRLFYTGDFRAHGRKHKVFEKLTAAPPANIDALVMEGTMMHRDNDEFPDEEAVQKMIHDTILDFQGSAFLITSSQNVDRLVSACIAARDSGKTLVVDLYTAWILEQIKLVSRHVPNMDWDLVRVYIPGSQYGVAKKNKELFGAFTGRAFEHRVEDDELRAHPGRFLIVTRTPRWQAIRDAFDMGPIRVLYSQWLGYLEEIHCHDDYSLSVAMGMNQLRADLGGGFVYAHTSGHAVVDDLKRLVSAMKPGVVIPVHTEHADAFTTHFPNTVRLHDGEEYPVSESRN
jgi:ribonuclease J